MELPPVYILSYQNPERKERILARFRKFGMEPYFVPEVSISDPRMEGKYKGYAVMYNHLDMIRHFVDHTDARFGLFCEDDIYLKRTILKDLPRAIDVQDRLGIDILNLGYLLPYCPDKSPSHFPLLHQEDDLTFYDYPQDLWGASMYCLSRRYAEWLLENMTWEKCQDQGIEFTSDWSITKLGKRALMYPILGLEEGYVKTSHQGQINFHRACSDFHYNPKLYI